MFADFYRFYFQAKMNCLNVLQTVLVIGCCMLLACFAYPMGLDIETNDSADDLCSLCYIYGDADICDACVLEKSSYPLEKRGPVFHPLLRGGYPKKSTYIPYYNPLMRGVYNKKSPYKPSYHPFLRGGYGGSYGQQGQQP